MDAARIPIGRNANAIFGFGGTDVPLFHCTAKMRESRRRNDGSKLKTSCECYTQCWTPKLARLCRLEWRVQENMREGATVKLMATVRFPIYGKGGETSISVTHCEYLATM